MSFLGLYSPRQFRRLPAGKRRDVITSTVVTLVMCILAFLWLFPFIWSVLTSLMTSAELSRGGLQLPSTLIWDNYPQAFDRMNYPQAFRNSMFFAGGTALLQCITGALAAYAFARLEFPGRGILFILALATLMIPGTVTLTANFVILNNLGWLDTFAALIIPSGASGFSIFLLRQFFMTLPKELEEAARLDGAGPLKFLFYIGLPLARPALVTVFIFVFISSYNEFLWPLVMTSSRSMRVLQIAMQTFRSELGAGIIQGPLLAAAILTMLPTIILFLFMQKAFIRGITRSGLK